MFGKTNRRREQLLQKEEVRINEEMPTTKTLGCTKIIQLGNTHTHTHTHTHTYIYIYIYIYNLGRKSVSQTDMGEILRL